MCIMGKGGNEDGSGWRGNEGMMGMRTEGMEGIMGRGRRVREGITGELEGEEGNHGGAGLRGGWAL